MDNIHFSSKTNEHYTPVEWVFKCVGFLGEIDLDPCSNSLTVPNVPAACHYTKEMNGLLLPWFGKVFVNPPYGRELKLWAEKAVSEIRKDGCNEILFLAPSRTDTKWYSVLANEACILHISGRLKFLNDSSQGNSAPFPSALFYLGDRTLEFRDCFSASGRVDVSQRLYVRRVNQIARAIASE